MLTTLLRRRIASSTPQHILYRSRIPSLQPPILQPLRTLFKYVKAATKREIAVRDHIEYDIPVGKKFKKLRQEATQILGGFIRSKTRRAQIINEEMVREILEREDWSGWRGCQIIDMNPGMGIFSRVLNELVQPSRHILLEPYKPFNDVLTERMITNSPTPSCTTTLFNLDGYDWASYDIIIKEGHFAPISVPHEQGVNKNILFVGNLLMKGLDGERFLTQIIEHIGPCQWIHQYGRIRMLVWVPDSGKIRFLPRKFLDRTRVSVLTDVVAEAKELAGDEVRYDHLNAFGREVTVAYENLMKYLKELEEKRAERAENPEKFPASTASSEEEVIIGEDGQMRRRKLAPTTVRQFRYPKREKEDFIGLGFKAELEAMYTAPGHKPWTPELEHPPFVYEAPNSPIERPPPPKVEAVVGSAAGRKKKDGTGNPRLITAVKKPHQPLTKALRRLPLPNEYMLANGYDAWQMLEVHKHQQSLDTILETWENETKNKHSLPPPPGEGPPLSVTMKDVKLQYLSEEQCRELGYVDRPNVQKSGVLLEELKTKFGDRELAMVWMKAVGMSKRKRELVDQLEEEVIAREHLQWHKMKMPPVKTERADVHPMEPVALLDFTPKALPEWLAGKDISNKLRIERWMLLNFVLRNVFILRSQSIKDALATLGPGAEQIAEGVEGLDDGKKKCRIVDADAFVELVQKYEDWPYRDKLALYEDMIAGLEVQAARDVGGGGKSV